MSGATYDSELVVREYLASFATADPDKIASFVSADFVNEHTAGLGSGCRGRSEYQKRLSGFLADMQGLRYEVEHLVCGPGSPDSEETGVAVFYRMEASWQGTAPFSVRGAQRLVVVDRLITQRTDYWDSAVFLAQVDANARELLETLGVSISN